MGVFSAPSLWRRSNSSTCSTLGLLSIGICIVLLFHLNLVEGRFYYKNFNDRDRLNINGDAVRSADCISLTDPIRGGSQVGSVWFAQDFVLKKGFSTTFSFMLASHVVNADLAANLNATTLEGVQGLALVIQASGSHVIGMEGSGMGYAGMSNGVAVEFDTFSNKDAKDPRGNHVAVHSALHSPLSQYESDKRVVANASGLLVPDQRETVQVSYDGEFMKVFFSNMVEPTITARVGVLDSKYWIGFTSSSVSDKSHAYEQTAQICDWSFDRKLKNEVCEDSFVGANCEPDSRPAMSQCIHWSTCNQCVASVHDCRWCASKKRCVPGVSYDAKAAAFCPDTKEIIDDTGCLHVSPSLLWIWTFFMAFLMIAVCLGFWGKMVLQPGAQRERRTDCTHELASLIFATAMGALFALGVSIAVNFILIEVSLSAVVAIMFGLLVIFIGGLIFWQNFTLHFSGPLGEFQGSWCHFNLLLFFSLEILTAGVACFLLEKDWTQSMQYQTKVPLYGLLGVALCFSLVFSVQDLLARIPRCLMADDVLEAAYPPSLVQSIQKIRLLAFTSIISGLYFGWVFGMLDIEDVSRSHIELALQEANIYCYPLGSLLGGFSAFTYHVLSMSAPANPKGEMKYFHQTQDDL